MKTKQREKKYDSWKTRLAIQAPLTVVSRQIVKKHRVKKNAFLSIFLLYTKTTLNDQLHNVYCP